MYDYIYLLHFYINNFGVSLLKYMMLVCVVMHIVIDSHILYKDMFKYIRK